MVAVPVPPPDQDPRSASASATLSPNESLVSHSRRSARLRRAWRRADLGPGTGWEEETRQKSEGANRTKEA
jgi:hypothetical protein